MNDHVENAKHIMDGVSVIACIGVLAGLLSPLAAIFTIIWTGIRIYEKVTGKNFSDSWIARKITGRA